MVFKLKLIRGRGRRGGVFGRSGIESGVRVAVVFIHMLG